MTSGLILRWMAPGTSPVDWCEANYSVSPHIAEFVNTISNVLFLVVPVACAKLWSSYAMYVTKGIHIIWVFFIIIGLCSAYFHATLSLLGQLLDELSILWVLMVSYSLFTPLNYRPKFCQAHPQAYQIAIFVVGVLVTASAFIQPVVNAYALFIFGVPAIMMMVQEIRACKNEKVSRLGAVTLISIFSAFIAWFCDRFMCPVWQRLDLAILHGLWHVLIFFGAYTTQVLFCYFHATQSLPTSNPCIRYWPGPTWGLPYVRCSNPVINKMP